MVIRDGEGERGYSLDLQLALAMQLFYFFLLCAVPGGLYGTDLPAAWSGIPHTQATSPPLPGISPSIFP